MAKSKTATQAKKKKKKKVGTNKLSLTATPKGFVKRIGRTGIPVRCTHEDPLGGPCSNVTTGPPKKWYLGHDEDKARLLVLQLQTAWKVRRSCGGWFPSDIAEFQVMKAALYRTEVPPDVQYEGDLARIWLANSLRNILDGTADRLAAALSTVRAYQKAQPLPVQPGTTATVPPGVASEDGAAVVTLHGGIDAFKKQIRESESRKPEWRAELCRRVDKIELALGNMPLAKFGHDEIVKTVESWIAASKKGKISPDTAVAYVRAMRHFCDWLDASNKIAWQAPRRWEKLFHVSRTQLIAGGNGVGTIGNEIRTFTVVELSTLYASADERVRLWMLLALNCGWTQIDIATMAREHLHLEDDPPYADRNRGKSGIYGRWYLWPETVAAIQTALKGAPRGKSVALLKNRRGNELLCANENGAKTDAIAQAWRRLRQNVGFNERGMSFKHLRKTGSQMIRNIAGQELSEAYLAHSDRTTGKHYNKFSDWSSMADALAKLREGLDPMVAVSAGD